MIDDLPADEQLLCAWLALTSTLWNRRIISGMPFNEAHILGLLLQNRSSEPMTATDLIARTHMLKSQMNKLLTGLEKKGFLVRSRSLTDRRMIGLRITPQGEAAYQTAHQDVKALLCPLLARIGEAQAVHVAGEITEIVSVLEDILGERAGLVSQTADPADRDCDPI